MPLRKSQVRSDAFVSQEQLKNYIVFFGQDIFFLLSFQDKYRLGGCLPIPLHFISKRQPAICIQFIGERSALLFSLALRLSHDFL